MPDPLSLLDNSSWRAPDRPRGISGLIFDDSVSDSQYWRLLDRGAPLRHRSKSVPANGANAVVSCIAASVGRRRSDCNAAWESPGQTSPATNLTSLAAEACLVAIVVIRME